MKFYLCSALLCWFAVQHARSDSSVNKKLLFPAELSIDNFVSLDPDFSEAQREISICAWVKTFRSDTQRYWFSYAIPSESNEILLSDKARYTWIFDHDLEEGSAVLAPNKWYHYCATWSAETHTLELYLNGRLEASESLSILGTMGTGGKLILGQDQDSFGGGFAVNQAFAGELYQLNILKKRLTEDKIEGLYRAGMCFDVGLNFYQSIILKWSDFLEAERHGFVEVVEGVCSKWEVLSDFIGQEITVNLIEHLKKHHAD